jgi:hypothetical protein
VSEQRRIGQRLGDKQGPLKPGPRCAVGSQNRTGPGRQAACPTAKTRRQNSAPRRRSAAVTAHRPRATAIGGQDPDPGRPNLEDDIGWCRLTSLPAACFMHASD